jgi:16S rRNA (adenine1518-N6/adenine1519-N6)-dimethyltransferase
VSAGWEDPRKVLARYGFVPKRSFSQNFLVSERAVRAITEACALGPDSRVVELGAGCGTLTQALAATGAHVFAVERDPDMLRVLAAECDPARVEVVAGDAKEVELARFAVDGGKVQVAGNLPYAITGAILRNLVEQSERVEGAVVMVQREVRDRLVAQPDTSAYGALTVFSAQVFAIDTVLHLPRTAFHPPPKVTSSVVRLRPLPQPRAERGAEFDRVVRAAFQARRKTLRNALAQTLDAATADALLTAAGIDGKRRGETLSIEEFGQIAAALKERGDTPSHT